MLVRFVPRFVPFALVLFALPPRVAGRAAAFAPFFPDAALLAPRAPPRVAFRLEDVFFADFFFVGIRFSALGLLHRTPDEGIGTLLLVPQARDLFDARCSKP